MSSISLLRPSICRQCLRIGSRPQHVLRRSYATSAPEAQALFKHGKKHRGGLPDKPARTRFAPSPTGYLHLGGLRTALYNYLLAKATGGQFLLRIEDTDQSRLVSDAEESLYRDLQWAGLTWDEGPDVGGPFGPYRQSERLPIYQVHAEQLIDSGGAFRCFCTPKDMLKHQQYCQETNQPMTYPGTCQALSPEESEERASRGEAHTIRFNARDADPSPPFRDLVYGNFRRNEPQDSRILIKSDGFPTYHFAHVVDDHLMGVTHVVRGAEWLITTPFHVSLHNAFGWDLPEFSHVCLLTDMNRQKLSKRNHDIGVASYREKGILPSALLNFSVLAGWHAGRGPEVMTLPEMVERFSFKFTKGDAIMDFGKLPFFQNSHIMIAASAVPPRKDLLEPTFTKPVSKMIPMFSQKREIFVPDDEPAPMSKLDIKSLSPLPLGEVMVKDGKELEDKLIEILRVDNQPYQTPSRFLHRHAYLIWRIPEHKIQWEFEQLRGMYVYILEDGKVDQKGEEVWDEVSLVEILEVYKKELDELPDEAWTFGSDKEINNGLLKDMVNRYDFMEKELHAKGFKWGWKVFRWILTGSAEGSSINQILLLLGKDESMRRFDMAIEIASSAMPLAGETK
ncbi:uncharacterized protein MKZ38_009529 [Zalerion maritima]|uniref:Glutamate--tRNA ligase, mitochondrial n=1 Tax=Zalerion maritima TaxID=339359 RepID=A0AAD5RV05_9PEZI|nr:uncharacterized protein MKZ38_009529 [Zalerion maritima]